VVVKVWVLRMICLGFDLSQKDTCLNNYCAEHGIRKVFVLSPEKFKLSVTLESEFVEWAEIIEYNYFYRLLQEVDDSTLVVVNECLRTQNRNDLTYNCMRHFLNQTKHQLIFQYLPIIDTLDDFMILFDLDTRSRWKRSKFSVGLLSEAEVRIQPVLPSFEKVLVPTGEKLRSDYLKLKRKLIDGIGLKDPHTIPRNLYLLSGKAKVGYLHANRHYIGRNNRFKLENLETYKEAQYPHSYTVFEFCHNFVDFCDFLSLSRQKDFEVLTTDLKVDQWYYDRYIAWLERLRDAYSALQ